ncbi:MAG TPA: conjugative transposon protein TraM [Niabella sp.]|nr:conjugative transposon protein TraM [Niabella sp.]
MKSEVKMSEKKLRLRKLLLVAPVLVLPFVILLLWTVGLVGDAKAGVQSSSGIQGMNLNLPAAAPAKDSNWNKLSYYEQAEKDSQKLKRQLQNDPFFKGLVNEQEDEEISMEGISEADYAEALYGDNDVKSVKKNVYSDPNEKKVYDRLAKLQRELNREPETQTYNPTAQSTTHNPEIENLQSMMQDMQSAQASSEDPELGKLDQMLDKIMIIQNPQKVMDDLQEKSEKKRGQVFSIQAEQQQIPVSTLEPSQVAVVAGTEGFYSIDDTKNQTSVQNASVNAVIHETQTLVNGSTIKLRLTDDIYINGVRIPKESFVFGIANLNGERLRVSVNSIRRGSQLFPVQLSVYDLDGLEGVRVPGAISREVVQQSTDRGLQGLGFSTVSPSVGLQAASLGVEAAKSFLSKKVKLVKVSVKAGYQVLLRDEKSKNSE